MVRPFFKNTPPLAEVVEESGPGRRLDPRVYFHDGETPFAEQSSGVPALVKVPLPVNPTCPVYLSKGVHMGSTHLWAFLMPFTF